MAQNFELCANLISIIFHGDWTASKLKNEAKNFGWFFFLLKNIQMLHVDGDDDDDDNDVMMFVYSLSYP